MATDTPSTQQLVMIIEGLLFVASEPVGINHLASAVECSASQVEAALKQLKEESQSRGVRLQRQGKKIQLVSAPELTDYIERYFPKRLRNLIMHGSNDSFYRMESDGNGSMKRRQLRPPVPGERFLAVTPNGALVMINGVRALRSLYESYGITWYYD